MTDILLLSVTEIADLFRRRALSPVELLSATLARAESVQAHLNPFRMIDREGAQIAAKASEQRWVAGSAG